MSLTNYDAWGKARATSGASAYQDPAPGTFYSPTPSGQNEGFAGHDNLEDTGLVDMEGRVYDPEVGNFLSPDPNVQYPFSSQGYNRYIYVNDNPLSLSDPSGYFSLGGFLTTGDPLAGLFPQQYGQVLSVVGPIVGAALNAVPGCQGWCDYAVTAASEAEAGYLETGSVGAGLRAGVLAGAEAFAFSYVGGQFGVNPEGGDLVARSMVEGIVGGAFSSAGGGRFSDGFLGAFVGSESSGLIGEIGGNPTYNFSTYYSASNRALRATLAAVVGGTTSRLAGGNFTEGAIAAALQQVFNDQGEYSEERRNAITTLAKEAEAVEQTGVLEKLSPALLQEFMSVTAQATSAADLVSKLGALSAGLAKITLEDGVDDIEYYKAMEIPPPTHIQYYDSLIKWGNVNWQLFDPHLDLPTLQVWRNFLQGVSSLPQYSQ
jgi:RHS repeat-associated protein